MCGLLTHTAATAVQAKERTFDLDSSTSSQNAPTSADGSSSPKRLDPVRIYVDAGITPAQEKEMRVLIRDYEMGARVKIARSKNMLERLRKMSQEASPDENVVIALQEEINKLQGDIALDRVKLMLKLRTFLSEEQRGKLAELLGGKPAGAGATADDAQ